MAVKKTEKDVARPHDAKFDNIVNFCETPGEPVVGEYAEIKVLREIAADIKAIRKALEKKDASKPSK